LPAANIIRVRDQRPVHAGQFDRVANVARRAAMAGMPQQMLGSEGGHSLRRNESVQEQE
jgi:hypothetical protein